MPVKLTTLVLLAAALYAASARADDSDGPTFSFNGFGTLGMVYSSERQADFSSNFFKPNGAGYTRAWSADVDSLIAGQVTANLTPQLSAVLQVVSEQNYDDTYSPHVEWANIKYQFTPDFSVRVGRTVLPTFLFSQTRKVGYTLPWVRPPYEVYSFNPLTNSDGLDVSYRLHVGESTHTMQANVGQKDLKLASNGGTLVLRNMWSISNTAELGALTAHIAYQKFYATAPSFNVLFDAFRQFGPQGVAIADQYDVNKKPVSIIGVGANYDPGNWFVIGEWSHINTKTPFGKGTGWYVSSGYRFGKFTPFVTYAQAKADNLSDPGLTVSALPPFLAGPATGLNAALNSVLSRKAVQNTISVGGRWDFMKNTDLKLQFDHTRIGTGSSGMLINIQPGFQTGGKVNVFSATLDFVF
ncbi:porin [Polaromonas hydrogenivorans]|uniref:Porin n=1 Tax=Polaromonas hydrogenivorans TaxID=335476 RepID=A0AAU7M080_9BURK